MLDEPDVMLFSRLSGLAREKAWNALSARKRPTWDKSPDVQRDIKVREEKAWNALSARKRPTFKKPGCSKGCKI